MKIRTSFVSNSSSSSFCIAKYYMTTKQIEEFQKLLDKIDDANSSDDVNSKYYETDTTVGETALYFLGNIVHNSIVNDFIAAQQLSDVAAFYE